MSNHTLRTQVRTLQAQVDEARKVVTTALDIINAVSDLAERALSVDWAEVDDVLVIVEQIAELTCD